MTELKIREQVQEELTWDLTAIFATDEQWEQEFKAVSDLLETGDKYAGKLGDSAETLLEALQFSDEVEQRASILYAYSHMRHDQDTTNTHYQGQNARMQSLIAKLSTKFSFMTPELLTLSDDTVAGFIASNEELAIYKQFLAGVMKNRPHVLPSEQEALLAQLGEVTGASARTFSALNNADLTFPLVTNEAGDKVRLTHGNYITFLESSKREVRKEAFKAMYATYGKFTNTFAATIAGQIKSDNVRARVRNYKSARHAAMSANDIPENVHDQLIATINKNLPLLHRYVALRKKVLGLDELHMYDLFTPLVAESEMVMPYDKAKDVMLESFAPLGKEYQAIVKEGLDNRWVDVEENKGKRSGAYSSGSYGTNPYILMNWQDNVNNLFTLAHEFGHSVHSYYSRKNQPYVYGDYSIFVAEVASTCNEELLNEYLLNNAKDDQEKIYLLNLWLDGFRSTVFRQTMFAEFEHTIHEADRGGEALTPEWLTTTYYELNKKYFGNDIVVDEEIGLEWSRIPHFYYNYYVYQYATGQSAAVSLGKQILEQGEPAVERYINNFLKAGCSSEPIDVLKAAGVDMSSAKPIEDACAVFEARLDELEALLM